MTDENTLIIKREFNAPVQLVWDVHSKPEHIEHWWGSKGSTTEVKKMNMVPGGRLHYCMNSEYGEMWGLLKYIDLKEPDKMVYINSFADAEGNIVRHPLSDTWPLEIHNTLEFEDIDGKTLLTLTSYPLNSSQEEIDTYRNTHGGVKQGMAGMFEQLENYLESLS